MLLCDSVTLFVSAVLNTALAKRPATAVDSAAKENTWQMAVQKPKATHLLAASGGGGGVGAGPVIDPDDSFQVNLNSTNINNCRNGLNYFSMLRLCPMENPKNGNLKIAFSYCLINSLQFIHIVIFNQYL